MIYFKKLISVFLLAAFAWVVLPPASVHVFFANHHDTECDVTIQDGFQHLENKHRHCDVFKINSLVYDVPEFNLFKKAENIIFESYSIVHLLFFLDNRSQPLGSRGPPII